MKSLLSTLLMASFLGASLNALSATHSGGGAAKPDSRMSNQGKANTNGPNSADRDIGQARAEDRRSAKGAEHEKATKHPRQKPSKSDKKSDKKSDSK